MTDDKGKRFGLLHEWLDILGKLFPAILAAVIGYLGFYLQDRMSATSLISEREKAESTLRASMFQYLLDPILGGKKEGSIGPEHERLIVELLALNFGEHFEFKPLLEHVDDALARQKMPPKEIEESRKSLRSVARRVIQRQTAMIQNQGNDGDLARISTVTVGREHGEPLCLVSPDGHNLLLLQLLLDRSNWREEMFEFAANIVSLRKESRERIPGTERPGFNCLSTAMIETPSITRSDVEFRIDWFNFPLTDNTLLADGNRFAVALDAVDVANETVRFKVVWFPKVYFSPRERPINHAVIRKKLGFDR